MLETNMHNMHLEIFTIMEMVWKRTLNVQWNTIKRLLCNQILMRNINWQKCMR